MVGFCFSHNYVIVLNVVQSEVCRYESADIFADIRVFLQIGYG